MHETRGVTCCQLCCKRCCGESLLHNCIARCTLHWLGGVLTRRGLWLLEGPQAPNGNTLGCLQRLTSTHGGFASGARGVDGGERIEASLSEASVQELSRVEEADVCADGGGSAELSCFSKAPSCFKKPWFGSTSALRFRILARADIAETCSERMRCCATIAALRDEPLMQCTRTPPTSCPERASRMKAEHAAKCGIKRSAGLSVTGTTSRSKGSANERGSLARLHPLHQLLVSPPRNLKFRGKAWPNVNT